MLLIVVLSVVATGQNGSRAPETNESRTNPIYITRVTVIDTKNGKELPDRTVILAGDRITGVAKTKDARVPPGAKVVDGRGKFLIPGLWDMHAHPLAPERRDTHFSLFLANGVTGVRDTGAWISLSEIHRWQQDLATGALVGPRIVGVAGPLVDGPGVKHARTGFPNETAVGTVNVTNATDARAVVATLQQQGADFIKVYNQVPREAFFALADEAKHRSMPIIGHVPWSVTVAEASNAGAIAVHRETGCCTRPAAEVCDSSDSRRVGSNADRHGQEFGSVAPDFPAETRFRARDAGAGCEIPAWYRLAVISGHDRRFRPARRTAVARQSRIHTRRST